MYLDLEPGDNLKEACMATFNQQGKPWAVDRVRLWRDDAWVWCAVCAWDAGAPAPAQVCPIEESGDGPALLVYGGDQGLRFAALTDRDAPAPAWDLDDAAQWAEPFLICRPDLQDRRL